MQPKHANSIVLPVADGASAAHSEQVAAYIRAQIARAAGSISFAEFMQHALYAPGLGYYAAGAAKLGPGGDFVTAPEVSPLFGYVLARQVACILGQLGGGDVLELGAGTGALAVSVLRKLDELKCLPNRYFILDVSADLRERQELRLRQEAPEYLSRVEWLSNLPQELSGVIIANEVADALPVERFTIRAGEVLQARVEVSAGGFSWRYAEAPKFLTDSVRNIERDLDTAFEDGFVSEVSPGLSHWVLMLSDALKTGFVFLIDYGVTRSEYYAAERAGGWLRCHFQHHAHDDPFCNPGIQDLTSWVDFTAVADAAECGGMNVAGFVTQAGFLLHGGLDEEFSDFVSLSVAAQVKLSGQVKLLTLPDEMGENFKCMGLSRGEFDVPPGLTGMDRSHLL